MSRTLSVLSSLVVASTVVATEERAPIPVYVFAEENTSGFVDDESKNTEDSLKDVKKYVSKKKIMRLVESPNEAVIILQVLGRNSVETGTETTKVGATGHALTTRKDTTPTVFVLMTVGNYELQIEGQYPDSPFLRYAADNAVRQVEDWIKKNYDKLATVK